MKASILCPMPYLPAEGGPRRWPVPPSAFDASAGVASTAAGLDLLQLADELGFDWVSLAEHHYSPNQLSPTPLVIAGALSQRIKRARIAVLGPILPALNPVRVAEEFAVLDMLTGGRVIAGLLRGLPYEFQTYGVNPTETRERFEEALELMLHAWSEPQPFAWLGRPFQFRTVSIWPQPLQRPHPPVVMSGKAPESARFAARHGLGMALSFNTIDECCDAVDYYREQAAAQGWTPPSELIVYRGFCYVAETNEQAEREAAAYGFGHLGNTPVPAGPGRNRRRHTDGTPWTAAFFCGTPERVVEQISYLGHEAGVGVVDLIFNGHGLPLELAERSLRLFGAEALPRLKDL